jgi:hypothetical protein
VRWVPEGAAHSVDQRHGGYCALICVWFVYRHDNKEFWIIFVQEEITPQLVGETSYLGMLVVGDYRRY